MNHLWNGSHAYYTNRICQMRLINELIQKKHQWFWVYLQISLIRCTKLFQNITMYLMNPWWCSGDNCFDWCQLCQLVNSETIQMVSFLSKLNHWISNIKGYATMIKFSAIMMSNLSLYQIQLCDDRQSANKKGIMRNLEETDHIKTILCWVWSHIALVGYIESKIIVT